MAFARMGCDGSDVYVYYDVSGHYTCCFCGFHEDDRFECDHASTMITHLKQHERLGDCVPADTYSGLLDEVLSNGDEDTFGKEDAWKDCSNTRRPPSPEIENKVKATLMVECNGIDYGLAFNLEEYDFDDFSRRMDALSESMRITLHNVDQNNKELSSTR